MHTTHSFTNTLAAWLMLVAASAGSPGASAAPMAPKAELRGMVGRVQYSHAGGAFQPVTKGAAFGAGDVIQTAGGAAVDLDFGAQVGTVRLTELTTLVVEGWSATEHGYRLNLFLRDGEMLGRVAHPVGPSRFEVKVNSGIGAIVEGQFRLSSKGYLVVLDGKGGFVHVPSNGEPVAHVLNTPPAQYFSPVGGVRTAPPELVKEVNTQFRSKLPKP